MKDKERRPTMKKKIEKLQQKGSEGKKSWKKYEVKIRKELCYKMMKRERVNILFELISIR